MKTAFYRHLDDLEGKNISIRYQTNRGSYLLSAINMRR